MLTSKFILCGRILMAAIVVVSVMEAVQAGGHHATEKRYFLRGRNKSWHSGWYNPAAGRPVPLVVPPTSEFVSEYSWGVPSSRVMPLYPQYRKPFPGPGYVPGERRLMPTPDQPSDTVQFGIHAIRGPWGSY
jgi:hypothetical protein